MVQDDGFPVYGNVTSIDQVERIQEYVDNKIMDLLNWVLTSLDIIVRGHTLVIGNIGQQVGKNIKQQQRRIQRVIDKHEKTVEVAVGMGYVYPSVNGEFPTNDPRPDTPVIIDEDFPVGDDSLPDEPPVLPPTQPPVQPPQSPGLDLDYPGFPPINPPGVPDPPVPPLPPTQPPSQPPTLPPIVIKPQETCDWGSSSQITSGLPAIPPTANRGVVIYGGQMNNCVSVSEYRDSAKETLHGIFGNSQQSFHIPGTLFPSTLNSTHWTHEDDIQDRALQVHNYNVPKITTAASSPFEELGEAVARGNRKLSDGRIVPYGGWHYPEWMHTSFNVPSIGEEIEGLDFISNYTPGNA